VGAEAISAGSEAVGFTVNGGSVTLHLADGRTATGDVLVGAGGVGSVIRRQLHPSEPPPRRAGLVAVRGAVHGALQYMGDRSALYYLGPGVESCFVRASDTGIYWFVSVARTLLPSEVLVRLKADTTSVGGDTTPVAVAAALVAHMAPQFDDTFRAITSATDDLRCDELVDRDPIPFWGTDAVTLLGDAAHPMLPHTGQGAAQAIVDAVALGKAMAGGGDVQVALRTYERQRQRKTASLVAQGRRTAWMMRTTNPIACAVREAVIRVAPLKPLMKLYVRINRRAGTDVRSG
jgi:2-polyprenyl-6-methoxyphenol hydroxylase-like FAD-dependent oxidoreductase